MGGGCSTLSATRPFSQLPETDAEVDEELAEDVDVDGDGVLSEDELRAALKGEDGKKARRALLKKVWESFWATCPAQSTFHVRRTPRTS